MLQLLEGRSQVRVEVWRSSILRIVPDVQNLLVSSGRLGLWFCF